MIILVVCTIITSTHEIYTTNIKHTNMSKINENESPTTAAIKLIGGKWKLCILWQLSQKKMRFGELQRAVGDITQQMLSKQLKEMSKDNLIKRKVYEVIPPKVEYSLTAFGKSGMPVVQSGQPRVPFCQESPAVFTQSSARLPVGSSPNPSPSVSFH